MKFDLEAFEMRVPSVAAFMGCATIAVSFVSQTLYTNILVAIGFCFLFLAWFSASLFKTYQNKEQYVRQKKVILAMGLCVLSGLAMLTHYEVQMPRYNIAQIKKELYRVPPQLSKKQLLELGRECNTYGNTLCSHDVFAKIVKLDPRNYQALANLAMAQSHLGFHQHATSNFERAIKNGVKAYDIYKFYGNSLKSQKKYKQAIKAYEHSLKLNPNQKQLNKKIARMKTLSS